MVHDMEKHISSKYCTRCHGEADGFKCAKCGKTAAVYDPLHWKNCGGGGRMRARCKACQESEETCTCA